MSWEDQHPRFKWGDEKPRNYRPMRQWYWHRIILWAALYLALVIGVVKAVQQW